eukprot:759928-Amphidinium_carterae.2
MLHLMCRAFGCAEIGVGPEVVYDKLGRTAKLFLFGILQEAVTYDQPLRVDMKAGYVGCWEAGSLKNQYQGAMLP